MGEITIPETPNVTLVAFYEKTRIQKSDAFATLIETVQQLVRDELQKNDGDASTFDAYDREQVHATVLGCEGANTSSGILSKWFFEKRDKRRYIDCDNLLQYFRWCSNLPIVVQFCAFRQDVEFPFTSRDEHPYFRSFQVRTDNNTAVLMGWPYRGGQYPLVLDQFRMGSQLCNALHKFHGSLAAVDNDCYVVLGRFTELPNQGIRDAIEKRIRDTLATQKAVHEVIDHTTLNLARYGDTALSLKNTKVWELDGITAEEMKRLYPDAEDSD